MNYEEARVYLDHVSKYGSVLGLENMKELLDRLGNPQDKLKFIHIAGTNGKGSVLAYLSTILSDAGYRIGRYISPTLFCYREKIQVDGAYIEKDALTYGVAKIKEVIDGMCAEGKAHPTVFEIETALGFLYFLEKGCDLVVLETGLGGLLDASNVVHTTVLEILTSISMDHIGVLGNNLEEIAEQKAGIIKPNTRVITGEQKPEVMNVIKGKVEEESCVLRIVEEREISRVVYGWEEQSFSFGEYEELKIALAGSCQISNAALAVAAVMELRTLGYEISERAVRKGLADTKWPGRFNVIQKEPIFILDGAHNESAAMVLADSLERYFENRKIYYIIGVFRDKEYEKILQITAPYAEGIITIETPGNPRALPAEELAMAAKQFHDHVTCAVSIQEAVNLSLVKACKEDVIIAFGSLSFLGEITRVLEEREVI